MYDMSQNTSPERGNTTLHERVATNLRAEMAAQRKSTAGLAGVLHINQRGAQNRCNGSMPISLNELSQIAAWLGIPVSGLMAERTVPAVAA